MSALSLRPVAGGMKLARMLLLLATLSTPSARRLSTPGPRMLPAAVEAPPASVQRQSTAPHHGKRRQRAKVLGSGSFDGPDSLHELLIAHGIDPRVWRKQPGCKSVDHLFTELELGEARLEFYKPPHSSIRTAGVRRLVEVVKVRVSRPGEPQHTLIEAHQRFSDGHTRSRGRSLSEKMFPHEGPLEAARRGVFEELGPAMANTFEESQISLDVESLVSWVEFSTSSSYPSLPTRYQLWSVDAVVEGIPAANFTTLEKVAKPEQSAQQGAPPVDAADAPTRETSKVNRWWSGAVLRSHRNHASASAGAGLRALELPEELLHGWEWVDTRQQRQQEHMRLQREHAQQRRRIFAEAEAAAKALAADTAAAAAEAAEVAALDDESNGGPANAAEVADAVAEVVDAAAVAETAAAGMTLTSGDCVIFYSPDGEYRISCGGDDLDGSTDDDAPQS